MLISFDIKGLEVVCGAYLSKDKVLYKELLGGIDVHTENQIRLKLPSKYIAKRFKFKILYGGTAYGFTIDPEFYELGFNEKKWQLIIDEYYSKYFGIRQWHKELIQGVLSTGRYISPTGREYNYSDILKKKEWYYIPKIKNYPVQGLGADVVMIARISLFRRMREAGCKSLLVNTIHDSIIIDAPTNEVLGVDEHGNPCYNICTEVEKVFQDLPTNLERSFDLKWDLPIRVEMKQL